MIQIELANDRGILSEIFMCQTIQKHKGYFSNLQRTAQSNLRPSVTRACIKIYFGRGMT